MVVRFRSDLDRMFWFQMSWPVRALIKMSVERNWQPINLSTATFIKEHMWWPFRLWWVGSATPGPPRHVADCKTANRGYFCFLLKMCCWLLKISYCELIAFYWSQRETFPTKKQKQDSSWKCCRTWHPSYTNPHKSTRTSGVSFSTLVCIS